MKKELTIFAAVTVVALTVATIGHATNPAICMAIKPMSWPFIALAVMLIRHLVKSNKKEK